MGNKISTRQDFEPYENIQNIENIQNTEKNKKITQYIKKPEQDLTIKKSIINNTCVSYCSSSKKATNTINFLDDYITKYKNKN